MSINAVQMRRSGPTNAAKARRFASESTLLGLSRKFAGVQVFAWRVIDVRA
jgi:hypothetical protein